VIAFQDTIAADFDALRFGPDLGRLGKHALVPFAARRIRDARLVWLNDRYWLDKGLNVLDPVTRSRVETWLLDTYAYCVPTGENVSRLTGDQKVFFADRYGGSDGSPQGGSGRCGISGRFNVKGIGRTPLVGDPERIDIHHSHGCLWLDEGLREILGAELWSAERRCGAVPVVALIDCGFSETIPQWDFAGRRALLVRPNFVRMAHLQRSLYFGDGGTEGSQQYLDELRVRDANLGIWGDHEVRRDLDIPLDSIGDAVERLADSVAFSLIARFYFGGLSPSNITLDGKVVDFGAFAVMPSWRKVQYNSELPLFGDEIRAAAAIIESLCFYRAKYAPEGAAENAGDMKKKFFGHLYAAFGAHVSSRLLGTSAFEDAAEIIDLFRTFYDREQRIPASLAKGRRRHWMHRALADGARTKWSGGGHGLRKELLAAMGRAEAGCPSAAVKGVLRAARYWMHPNPSGLVWAATYRSRALARKISSGVVQGGRAACVAVNGFLAAYLSKSRRYWKDLPKGYVPVAQACTSTCSIVVAQGEASDDFIGYLEGQVLDGNPIVMNCLPEAGAFRFGQLMVERDGYTFCFAARSQAEAVEILEKQFSVIVPKLVVFTSEGEGSPS